MVRKTVIAALLACSLVSAGDSKPSDADVRKAYYSSYELEKQARYSEAAKALNSVVKAYPTGYTVNYRLGWLYYKDGKFTDAYKYYTKALAVYPSSIEVLQSITLIEVAREDWKKVEEQSKKIIKIDYYNQNANYWYAVALRMQNQCKEAAQVMEKMTYLYPTSTSYLNEYAKIQYCLKKYDHATQLFGTVLVLDPYNQDAVEYLKKIEKR